MSDTVVIFLVGSFVAASCALVGSFLVLRTLRQDVDGFWEWTKRMAGEEGSL